jgi:dCMP deaminase
MKQKFLDAYMDVAFRFSELSTAVRLKVGAIIVKDDRIISIGYNGTPPLWSNECENREYMGADAILQVSARQGCSRQSSRSLDEH